MSLRARLVAGMALVAIVLFAVAALNTRSTRSELIGRIDDRLVVLASVDDDRRFDGDDEFGGLPPVPPGGFDRFSDIYEGRLESDGTLRDIVTPNVPGYESAGAPDVDLSDVPERGYVILTAGAVDSDVDYRVLVEAAAFDHAHVSAIPIDDVEQTIDRLVLVQLLGSLAVLAALGLVGWWVVHLGIRPVKRMTDAATQIAEGDLTVRVPEGQAGTESGQLAVALNQMLGHIESALDERARSEGRLRQFVADASHELRTPLTTIRGYAELYRMGGLAKQESLDDAMRRTEQEATRMGRLVEDMLTLAKFDEERPLDLRPVDLLTIARDAAADGRARAPERPIVFEASVDTAVVSGDEDRLRQVVGNVISNAIVHTEPTVAVTVRVARLNGDVVLEVADAGTGMPAEVTARVTERFFRADPARARNRGGSGLGLSIVDAAVSAHGGTVEIDSVEGRGTTVRLVLPALT